MHMPMVLLFFLVPVIPIFLVVGIPSFYLEFDSNRGFVNFKMQMPMVWPIFLVVVIPIFWWLEFLYFCWLEFLFFWML